MKRGVEFERELDLEEASIDFKRDGTGPPL